MLLLGAVACAGACLYGPATASAFCEPPPSSANTAYLSLSCTPTNPLGTSVVAVPLAPGAYCSVADGLGNAACVPVSAAVDAAGTDLCAGVPAVYVPLGGPTGPTTGPGAVPEADVGVCLK
jgi:hypothetical protein